MADSLGNNAPSLGKDTDVDSFKSVGEGANPTVDGVEDPEVPAKNMLAEATSESEELPNTGLTSQEIARLKKIARKRFLIALVVGMLMAVMGYFAGKGVRATRDAEEQTPTLGYAPMLSYEEYWADGMGSFPYMGSAA